MHNFAQVIKLYQPVDQWPSNEVRKALYWDGKNPIDVPRSLLTTGFVAEVEWAGIYVCIDVFI